MPSGVFEAARVPRSWDPAARPLEIPEPKLWSWSPLSKAAQALLGQTGELTLPALNLTEVPKKFTFKQQLEDDNGQDACARHGFYIYIYIYIHVSEDRALQCFRTDTHMRPIGLG